MAQAAADDPGRQSLAPRMGPKAASAMLFMGMAQAGRLVLTVLSTVVVARILSPGDYGLIAMVAPVTAFVMFFQDLGLNSATIQAKSISAEQSNSLFWRNMLASVVIALALVALSPAAAWFYADIRAGFLTAASALGVLLGGLALQHTALMTRDLRFGTISAIEMSSAALGFAATVALALAWRNYWALFVGGLITIGMRTVLTWANSNWRPSRPNLGRDVRDMTRFGRDVMGFNLINFFVRNADNVLIAKVAGAGVLGLYDRSYRLMMFPIQTINQPINRLMLPVLSRLSGEPERYRRTFLLAASVVCWAALPGIILATALSDGLVVMLMGERWAAAGPIFFWLGLTGVMQTVPNLTGSLFMSTGNTRTMMAWSVFSAVVTLVGFGVGLIWGGVGVAASLFVTTTARTPVLFAICRKGTAITQKDLYAVSAGPILGASVAALAIRYGAQGWGTPLQLMIGLIAVYGSGSLVVLATAGGRDVARRSLALMLAIRNRKRDLQAC